MNTPQPHRPPTWLGHFIFAVLAVLAVVLYKERVIFLDAAFQSFNAISFGHPAIQANRFGAALTQMVPVVVAKLGASLPLVLISYSLGFVLLHWLFFVLADRVFKQPALALAIAFFNIFLFNRSFYWIQNELVQAIGLNLLVWAIALHALTRGWRWWHVGLLILLLPTLVFFHPLVMFPYFFCCAFFLLDHWRTGGRRERWALAGMALAFLAVLWVKNQWFMPEYDAAATQRFSQGRVRDFLAAFPHNPSLRDFGRALLVDFYLLPLAQGVLSIFYARRRAWRKLSLVWLSVVGFTFMVLVAFQEGGNWFHAESQYLPLSIFVILPLVWDVWPPFRPSKEGKLGQQWVIGIILLLVTVRLIDMALTSRYYSERLQYISELLDASRQAGGTKFIIDDDEIDKSRLVQTWGFAYETLYLSTLASPDSTRSIMIAPDAPKEGWRTEPPDHFMSIFDMVPYDRLPAHLFHFDTTERYRIWTPEVDY